MFHLSLVKFTLFIMFYCFIVLYCYDTTIRGEIKIIILQYMTDKILSGDQPFFLDCAPTASKMEVLKPLLT